MNVTDYRYFTPPAHMQLPCGQRTCCTALHTWQAKVEQNEETWKSHSSYRRQTDNHFILSVSRISHAPLNRLYWNLQKAVNGCTSITDLLLDSPTPRWLPVHWHEKTITGNNSATGTHTEVHFDMVVAVHRPQQMLWGQHSPHLHFKPWHWPLKAFFVCLLAKYLKHKTNVDENPRQ